MLIATSHHPKVTATALEYEASDIVCKILSVITSSRKSTKYLGVVDRSELSCKKLAMSVVLVVPVTWYSLNLGNAHESSSLVAKHKVLPSFFACARQNS